MKKFFFVLFIFLVGCVSTRSVEQAFQNIDYSDGVSAIEAKRIAQKFLLSCPGESDYMVSAPQVDGFGITSFQKFKDRAWVIGFSAKTLNIFSPRYGAMFVVGIDKNTGNILFYQDGWGTGRVPLAMESYGPEGISSQSIGRP